MKWAAILIQAVEGEMMEEESQKIYDDLTGKELDPKKVKASRNGEMESVKNIRIYEFENIKLSLIYLSKSKTIDNSYYWNRFLNI